MSEKNNIQDKVIRKEPKVMGNDKIEILKHQIVELSETREEDFSPLIGLEVAVRNISDSIIATTILEAVFYDCNDDVIDTVKHKEFDLRPHTSRSFHVISTKIKKSALRNYDLIVSKSNTTDVEPVILIKHGIRTTPSGDEVQGIVKNISDVKVNAALVVTMFNNKNENISTKVHMMADIEPNKTREYDFTINTNIGDAIEYCTITIGDVIL